MASKPHYRILKTSEYAKYYWKIFRWELLTDRGNRPPPAHYQGSIVQFNNHYWVVTYPQGQVHA